MQRFVKRCYTTDQILFFYSGATPFSKIQKYAERYFTVSGSSREYVRPGIDAYKPVMREEKKETYQTHCILGNRSYGLGHPERLALVLLNNILGGPFMSSRLNHSIRERNGLAYTIESGLTTYTDSGVWNIYFGCDPKNVNRCLTLIERELDSLRDTTMNETQLKRAKRQVEGQLLIGNQNKENLILGMAKSYLHRNECLSDQEILSKIESITALELQSIANEVFNKEQITQLVFQ